MGLRPVTPYVGWGACEVYLATGGKPKGYKDVGFSGHFVGAAA
jgi:hypothetical protein